MFGHLLYAALTIRVGDGDKVESCWLIAKVNGCFAFAGLKFIDTLPQIVIYFNVAYVFAGKGAGARSGVGVDVNVGKIRRFIWSAPIQAGLTHMEWIVGCSAKQYS